MATTSTTPLLSEYDQDNFSCWKIFKTGGFQEDPPFRWVVKNVGIEFLVHLVPSVLTAASCIGGLSCLYNQKLKDPNTTRILGWCGFSISLLYVGGQLIRLYKHHCGFSKNKTRCFGKTFLLWSVVMAIGNVYNIILVSKKC